MTMRRSLWSSWILAAWAFLGAAAVSLAAGPRLDGFEPMLKEARAHSRRLAPQARLYGVSLYQGGWGFFFHEAGTFRQLQFNYSQGKLMDVELRQIRPPAEGYIVADQSTDLIAHFKSELPKDGRWWTPKTTAAEMPPGEYMKPYYRQACSAIGEGFMDTAQLQKRLDRLGVVLQKSWGGRDFRLALLHPLRAKGGCLGLFEDESMLPKLDELPAQAAGRAIWVAQTARERMVFDARDGELLGRAPVPAPESN